MSLQRLAERVWADLPAPKPVAKENVFQRLDDASALWLAATGKGFDSLLPPADLARLRVHYQRRHLLSHCEGMVDDKYLAKSGDTQFSSGQRITVDEASLLEFAGLAERLGHALLDFLPGRPAPSAPAQPTTSTPTHSAASDRPRNRRGLSTDAERVAQVFVERSGNGREGDLRLGPDAVREVSGLPDKDIAEAMYELELAGLVKLQAAWGMGSIGFVIATPLGGMFEVFDPVFGIGDPLADAKLVGQQLLDAGERRLATSELAETLGWKARRMNPAVWVLTCRGIADGSRALDPVWDCAWIRARPGLRRFVRGETR